jgi:hypothetical protein
MNEPAREKNIVMEQGRDLSRPFTVKSSLKKPNSVARKCLNTVEAKLSSRIGVKSIVGFAKLATY